MSSVKIAQLKSRLSEHLRAVRRGSVITVVDRTTPVARLVPIDSADDVIVTRPAPGAPRLGTIKRPRGGKVAVDVVALLLEDRRRR